MLKKTQKLWVAVAVMALFGMVLGAGCSKKKVEEDPLAGAGTPQMDPGAAAAEMARLARENLKSVYFALDKFTLSEEARSVLKKNADWLKNNATVVVQIEGHCDERGSIEYNLALGEKRANSVKTYLSQLGVDGSRLQVISYGEERPADAGHTEGAWSKNRRSEFVLLSQ